MDISSTISFIVGLLIALAAGWLGWQEWSRASDAKKLEIVQRTVYAVEEYAKHAGYAGSEKLAWVMGRLKVLLPKANDDEIGDMVHAEVAKLNATKQAGTTSLPRGYFTD